VVKRTGFILRRKYFLSKSFVVYRKELSSMEGSDVQINDIQPDEESYSSKRRRTGTNSGKSFQALLGVVIALVVIGGIMYFVNKRGAPSGGSLEGKVASLEQKITQMESQLAEIQGKVTAPAADPALAQRVDMLVQRVEALEKKKQAPAESKMKDSGSAKPASPGKKQSHTVQKGETLSGISKKYGISVEELRKLNNLPAGQPLRVGQKLAVSPHP
jgi:LysM repeat protein